MEWGVIMDDIELLQCLVETEIKTLEYKIQLEKKKENKDSNKIFMYKHQKAGLKRTLGFMNQIQDMEE